MTPAQQRAMRLGVLLHKVRTQRAARAQLMEDGGIDRLTPAAQPGYVAGLAAMDHTSRLLRILLCDELLETAGSPVVPFVPAWGNAQPPRWGRHHKL